MSARQETQGRRKWAALDDDTDRWSSIPTVEELFDVNRAGIIAAIRSVLNTSSPVRGSSWLGECYRAHTMRPSAAPRVPYVPDPSCAALSSRRRDPKRPRLAEPGGSSRSL